MRYGYKLIILASVDIVLLFSSVIMAYLLRFDLQFDKILPEFYSQMYFLALAAALIKVATLVVMRFYTILWRYAGVYELLAIAAYLFIGNVLMLSYVFLTNARVPRSIFVMTLFVDIFLIGAMRYTYRILERIRSGELKKLSNFRKVMVIGAEHTGSIIVKELKAHPELGGSPVAIIDEDRSKLGGKLNGVPIVGQYRDIAKAVRDYKIDEIIIALPKERYKLINQIFSECSKTKCKVKILPAMSQLIDESVAIQKVREVSIEDLLGREPITLDNNEISTYLKDQTVMITGGGGSIGSELCRQVAFYKPKALLILDNYENGAYDIQNELCNKFPEMVIHTVIANIREKYCLNRIFAKYLPDVVFHAAAHKHVPLMEANPLEAIKNNILGTMNVAECAEASGVKKFVQISTDKAVNPTNVMGATKRYAETIIQGLNSHSKTEFVAVRFGNVLGSNGSVIPLFKKQIEAGGPVTVTHPEVTRFFMTIPEAVQLVMQAGAMAKGGEIFVLDMGESIKINDLARNLIKLSGFEPDQDIEIKFIGMRPGEKLYEELLLAEEGLLSTENNKIHIAQSMVFDYEKIKEDVERLKVLLHGEESEVLAYLKKLVPTYTKEMSGHLVRK